MRLAGPSDNFQPPGDRLEKKKLENFSSKNLEVKKKSLPLQPQSRNDSDKSSLRDLHNSTSSTSIGKLIFRIDTVKEVWLWTTINGFRSEDMINNLNNEEFDPGSGWTLATGLTHASRGAARCSNTLVATGARVSNAYATYLSEGNNPAKVGLIPHKTGVPHGNIC